MRARLGIANLLALLIAACRDGSAPDPLRPHYLIDFGGPPEKSTDFQINGHLVVFNRSDRPANLDLTAYFEEREPKRWKMIAKPGTSTETSSQSWGIPQGLRYAIEVRSDEPIVAQATVGWTNTGGDYSPNARTSSPRGIREAAKSYVATRDLPLRAFVADGIVLDGPQNLWIRESEWALLLNPGEAPAHVVLSLLGSGWQRRQEIEVPPRRLRALYMDDIAPRNEHYGVEMNSDRPVAMRWVREVRWYDSPEIMGYWSVPAVAD